MARPLSSTEPSVVGSTPASIRSTVVFPAPLAPRSTTTSPGWTLRLTRSRTGIFPYPADAAAARMTGPESSASAAILCDGQPGSRVRLDDVHGRDHGARVDSSAGLDRTALVLRPEVRVDDRLIGPQLARQTARQDHALIQDDHSVTGLHDKRNVVFHEQHRDVPTVSQTPNQVGELSRALIVEACGRLVQEQHGGVGGDRPCDAHQVPLRVRELRDGSAQESRQIELIDHGGQQRAVCRSRGPDQVEDVRPRVALLGRYENVLLDGELLEQFERLPRTDEPASLRERAG